MTSDWPWTQQSIMQYTPSSSEDQILVRFAYEPAVFEIQGCCKSEMRHMTLRLNVKVFIYTKYLPPPRHKFGQFCSTTNHFWDASLSKIGNSPNDFRMTFEHWTVKGTRTLHTGSAPREVHTQRSKFYSTSLYDQPFLRYKTWKIEKCTEWPQIDLEHLTVKKYPIYIKHPWGPNLCPILLYDQPISRSVVKNLQSTEWPWTFNSQK